MTGLSIGAYALFMATAGGAGAEPYSFGPLARRLTVTNVAVIYQRAGLASEEPLALFGWRSQILPEVWFVDVFMPPTRTLGLVRRGPVLHLQCTPVQDGVCSAWSLTSEETAYVQVLDRPVADGDLPAVASLSERPIRIAGAFSDEDLVSLVTFIRKGPAPSPSKDGWQSMSVTTSYPILDISEQGQGSIRVVLSADGGVGQTVQVRRGEGGWQIEEVVGWVA